MFCYINWMEMAFTFTVTILGIELFAHGTRSWHRFSRRTQPAPPLVSGDQYFLSINGSGPAYLNPLTRLGLRASGSGHTATTSAVKAVSRAIPAYDNPD